MVQLVVVVAVGLVAWWLQRKRRASKAPPAPPPPPVAPGRTAKAGEAVTTIGRLLLAVPVVWAVAAMARGCEDEPSGPSAPATAVEPGNGGDTDDDESPDRMTCGSYREEDCPPYPSILVPGDGSP